MAGVGGMGDNSFKESEESPGKALSHIVEMCKKNGINNGCHCGDKPGKCIDGKRVKIVKTPRINGVSKITIKPSIPTLRSRAERRSPIAPESPKKKRRSARLEKQDILESVPSSPIKVIKCEVTGTTTTTATTTTTTTNPSGKCEAASTNNNDNSLDSALSACLEGCRTTPDTSRSCTPLPPYPPGLTKCSSQTSLAGLSNCSSTNTSFSSFSAMLNNNQGGDNGGKLFLRFPSVESKEGAAENKEKQNEPELTSCQWQSCNETIDVATLMEHIRNKHVDTQKDSEVFRCLWEGCKVYNKPSCSLTWLERHILCHSGDKPFRCIVEGCGQRFTSHGGLERHVNSHFNTYQPVHPRSSRSKDDTPSKLLKKKKLKKRRSWLKRTDDFFDCRIMESLRHQLVVLSEKTQLDISGSGNSVTFHSTVIAKRTEESGKVKVLLHWTPEEILPDTWVPESQAQHLHQQTIPFSQLPRDTATNLDTSVYNRHRYRKHRRK